MTVINIWMYFPPAFFFCMLTMASALASTSLQPRERSIFHLRDNVNESFPGCWKISTPSPHTYLHTIHTQPHFHFIFSFPALFYSPQDLALSYLLNILLIYLVYWLPPLPERMTQEGKEFYLLCSLLYPRT